MSLEATLVGEGFLRLEKEGGKPLKSLLLLLHLPLLQQLHTELRDEPSPSSAPFLITAEKGITAFLLLSHFLLLQLIARSNQPAVSSGSAKCVLESCSGFVVHNNRGLPICCCLFSPCIAKLTSGKAAEPLFKDWSTGEELCVCVFALCGREWDPSAIWQRARGSGTESFLSSGQAVAFRCSCDTGQGVEMHSDHFAPENWLQSLEKHMPALSKYLQFTFSLVFLSLQLNKT